MVTVKIGTTFFQLKDGGWISNKITDETSRSWVDMLGNKISKKKPFENETRKFSVFDSGTDSEYLRKASLAIHDFMIYGGRQKLSYAQAKDIIEILEIDLKL